MPKGMIVAGIAAVLIVTSASQALAIPPAPTPVPSVHPSPSSSPAALPHPKPPGFWDVIGRVRYAISQWFTGLVTAALRPVFGLLSRTVFSTPDVAGNARVVDLWHFSAGIADALLALFVLVGAGIVTAGGGGLSAQTTAKELLPRLVLAAAATNVSLVVVHLLAQFSAALSKTMLGVSGDPAALAGRMMVTVGASAIANPFLALLSLAVVVLAVLVLIAYIIRVAALTLLAAGAPLMLVGHCLPQSESLARTWWRMSAALGLVPVIQSMLCSIALRMFLTDGGVLGLPIGNGLIDLLVVGCLLYLFYKITFLSLRYSFSGSGRSVRRLSTAVYSLSALRRVSNLVRTGVSA